MNSAIVQLLWIAFWLAMVIVSCYIWKVKSTHTTYKVRLILKYLDSDNSQLHTEYSLPVD